MKRFQNFSFKTFLYRTYLILLGLLALYAIAGIAHFKWLYIKADKPAASFLIQEAQKPTTQTVTLIEFIDYTYCKEMNPTVEELLRIRKDVRYIARPVEFDVEVSEPILRHVLAAGLQGKFWEMHKAVLEYPEREIPETFFEETAALYGLDLQKFKADVISSKVDEIMEDNLNALLHAGIQVTPSFLIENKVYVPGNAMPTLVDLINMIQEGEK